MPRNLFERIIVPVASEDDAEATIEALTPHVEAAGGTVIVVNVIEKAGGAPDKASVEQRELLAEEIFETAGDALADVDVDVETEILYGTDIAETVIDAAHEMDVNAIVFTPRGGNRWLKLLTGDVTTELVNKSDLPVIVLPDSADGETDT